MLMEFFETKQLIDCKRLKAKVSAVEKNRPVTESVLSVHLSVDPRRYEEYGAGKMSVALIRDECRRRTGWLWIYCGLGTLYSVYY